MVAALVAAIPACAGSGAGPTAVVVEEHHLAFAVLEEARARGEIPAGLVLVHLDAHEDMGVPNLSEPLPDPVDPATARRVAERDLTVDDVVMPALFTGTVGRLTWVVPPWFAKVPERGLRWVGSKDGNRREIEVGRSLDADRWPDRRAFVTEVVSLDELTAPDAPYVLDIDLDFFACENPHAAHSDVEIGREEYERRLSGGRVRFRGEATSGETVTESIVLARSPGPFAWPVRLDRIRSSATGEVRHVRGYMCMGEYRDSFPVHRPDDEEVAAVVSAVRTALGRFTRPPALITISRSARSGFVPADRVDAIEGQVLGALRTVWPGLEVSPQFSRGSTVSDGSRGRMAASKLLRSR